VGNTYIRHSDIEGKGTFAARDFNKGEVVFQWDITHKISNEEYTKLAPEEKDYVSYLNGQYIEMQEPERYINHSCEPNTRVGECCDIAIRDIKKGEEITSDYSRGLAPGEEMKCNCGSENCKRIIRGEDT
jgi:hypothetical protein